jgi:hypothetical protein
LLAEHGIKIPSDDREGREEAFIYGSEYYALEDAIVAILMDRVVGYVVGKRSYFGPDDKAAGERMRKRVAEAAIIGCASASVAAARPLRQRFRRVASRCL